MPQEISKIEYINIIKRSNNRATGQSTDIGIQNSRRSPIEVILVFLYAFPVSTHIVSIFNCYHQQLIIAFGQRIECTIHQIMSAFHVFFDEVDGKLGYKKCEPIVACRYSANIKSRIPLIVEPVLLNNFRVQKRFTNIFK